MENKLFSQLIGAGLPYEMVARLVEQIERNRAQPDTFQNQNVGMRGNQNALRIPMPGVQPEY